MADNILVIRVKYPADLTGDQRAEIAASSAFHAGLMVGHLTERTKVYALETSVGWVGQDPFVNIGEG